jgi:hypothetical protein
LVRTHDRERVKMLIHHLAPTGRLLLLRVRDPEGSCIAICDLYIGMKKRVEYWGSASLRSGQRLKPNEAIRWYAILETARYGKVILGPADSLQGK